MKERGGKWGRATNLQRTTPERRKSMMLLQLTLVNDMLGKHFCRKSRASAAPDSNVRLEKSMLAFSRWKLFGGEKKGNREERTDLKKCYVA